MCSSIGAYIVVKVWKLKPPVSFVFCINIVLDSRVKLPLVAADDQTLSDNVSAPNLRLEAR
ncbi:unnamed protein product, partial [Brassica rapa]